MNDFEKFPVPQPWSPDFMLRENEIHKLTLKKLKAYSRKSIKWLSCYCLKALSFLWLVYDYFPSQRKRKRFHRKVHKHINVSQTISAQKHQKRISSHILGFRVFTREESSSKHKYNFLGISIDKAKGKCLMNNEPFRFNLFLSQNVWRFCWY